MFKLFRGKITPCIVTPPLLWEIHARLLGIAFIALLIFTLFIIVSLITKKQRQNLKQKYKKHFLWVIPVAIYFIVSIIIPINYYFYVLKLWLLVFLFLTFILIGRKYELIKNAWSVKFLTIILVLFLLGLTIISFVRVPEGIRVLKTEQRNSTLPLSDEILFINPLGSCPPRIF